MVMNDDEMDFFEITEQGDAGAEEGEGINFH